MLRHKKLTYLFFLLISCTQELDFPFPQGKEQLVLNSILHPDSTIKVSLTKTLPMGTTRSDFSVVGNAEIYLYEDDVFIGSPTFQDSVYMLDYWPKVGKEYSIEVEVPGFATLRAADMIPDVPVVKACIMADSIYSYFNASIVVDIMDQAMQENFYWLYTTTDYYDYRNCEGFYIPDNCLDCVADCADVITSRDDYYLSYSSLPDRFNGFVDNTSGGVTQYDLFMRFDDKSEDGQSLSFKIASHDNIGKDIKRFTDVHIISASANYDKYLKSTVTYFLNKSNYSDKDTPFKPFSEITQTYSNVENGAGIFAAYNKSIRTAHTQFCE
jgi:hypothetical protein